MKYKSFVLLTAFILITFIFYSCKSNSTGPSQSSNHMNLIGSYNTPGYSQGICIETIAGNTYAFVADGPGGLQIINVTNRSNPLFVSRFQTGGSALDVTVAPINSINYALISDGNQGLHIVSLVNLSSPLIDTTLLIPNDQVLTAFVDAVNKIAYVGTFYGKMYIYNLSNLPVSVNQLSVYTGFDHIMGIQVLDNIAYLAEASVGLDIVNVINPITPGWIKSFHTSDIAYDVKVSGHYVYLADASNGIMIIDVTDPFNPAFVSSMKTSGATYVGLSYNSSFLYSADANFGVETFNVATPTSPLEIGNYITSDIAQRVFYQNGYIYVAASSQGLLILQYQP